MATVNAWLSKDLVKASCQKRDQDKLSENLPYMCSFEQNLNKSWINFAVLSSSKGFVSSFGNFNAFLELMNDSYKLFNMFTNKFTLELFCG